jgi:mono/diheme cytochrome c family protein
MPIIKSSVLAAASIALTTVPGFAADAAQGLLLAKRWCAACHLVAADQKEANADAPPFATIASAPHFSAEALAYFLLDPHPKMPDLPLSRYQASDIAAYIVSLRK